MPSFIYIARIKRISEELAQSLRSSGCHVKYFKPGEITGDGCLLAMTSEAADGASRPEGDRAGTDGKFAGMPPAPDMSEQLGVQAAVWNSLKTAVSNELGATPVETEAIKSGSTPAEVGQGGISGTQGKAAVEIAQIEPSQIPAVSSSEASPDPNRIRLAIAQCYRFFRSPLSTVIALLVFSVAYRSLSPLSTTVLPVRRKANYVTRSDSPSTSLLLNSSASLGPDAHRSAPQLTRSSTERPPQAVDRVKRRLSESDSVAEDFTHHFALPAQGGTTQQNLELKHPQRGSIQKRIVVN